MPPLTVRSHYSLMWGVASVKRLCRRARRLGYTRLALTDTDNLYGLWPFLTACRREGLTPIVGAEVTDPRRAGRAVCLVENEAGFANLCRLLTRRHMNADFDLEKDMPALADGLVVLTQGPDLLRAWHRAGVTVAGAMPRRPLAAGHALRRTARELGVRCAATPGAFFLDPGDLTTHRMLRAIHRNTSLARVRPGDMAPPEAWLAGPDEYARRFAICPEAVRDAHELAQRLEFTGPAHGLVMPPLEDSSHRDVVRLLRRDAYAGAARRYGRELSETVVERLEYELRIIEEMGFSDYFLIVRDIVARSPRTCGRGSGAASLVGYCLGVSNVCPIKHNLYFERFLNPGRTDPPDIDVDFAWDERDNVLNDVLERRRGCAAMVSSHVLFQPRMAVREAAKVFGLGEGEIKRISDRLPHFWRTGETDADLQKEIRKRPRSRFLEFPAPWPEVLEHAKRILGAPRYLSVHPGGVVITPGPIDAYVPVERAPKGVPVMQWEKDGAEAAGLVKIDLLGNR
ncbi:MAG: DNA polymerase III subunit alpha, partial [Desulfobacterales bacterium]|nr:DNA polymerase III subunit alpha [Desulfobacterales bacterium]